MRCCIASSTTSRLKDKDNQSFVGTTIYVQAMGRLSAALSVCGDVLEVFLTLGN
jgi:hypothetical protein